MVFQDPMTSLNPARIVGSQVAEAVRLHEPLDRAAARRRAVELLDQVGIPDPKTRVHAYPHQLSGGMRQRVMIAMALAGRPRVLLADEPTTALDVTVQAQILELLRELSRDERLEVVLVTHDLGVVAETCDRVAVMYAGQIVETAATSELFAAPRHPYTEGLIATSRPEPLGSELVSIPGQVPRLGEWPTGCRFRARCTYATDLCARHAPPLEANPDAPGANTHRHEITAVWAARCWHQDRHEREPAR
jgi:oligopeptide/dipeptide ABC transporter ATP-binding protein